MNHRRVLLVVLAAILSVSLGALAQPISAHQALLAPPTEVLPSPPADAPAHGRGSITGRVEIRGNTPRVAAYVQALREGQLVREAAVGPDGYKLADLPAGAYTLSVLDQQRRELRALSDNRALLPPGASRRILLRVDADSPAGQPARDAAPAGIAPAAAACEAIGGTGSIAGTVRGPGGTPVANVIAELYTATSSRRVTYDYTDAAGAYSIGNLVAGTYFIRFNTLESGQPYQSEWYDGKADRTAATPITVVDGAPTPGIDATLQAGAQIAGQVTTDDTHAPLPSVRVQVYDSAGELVANGSTNAAGNYTTTPGLPSGAYRVHFDTIYSPPPYLGEYYDNKPSLATATPVVLTAPNITGGIDAALSKGAQIRGRVTDAVTGAGIPSIAVGVDSLDSDGYIYGPYTDSNGYYTTTAGLPSGNYRLTFGPVFADSDYIPKQRTVAVSAPNVLAGVDAALETGGRITGRVTDSGGNPLQNITIFVADETNDYQRYVYTDAAGNYTAHALPTNGYRVFFRPSEYIEEYYNDKPDRELADIVHVSAPATKTGVDAVLAKGGAIGGRVTAADTGLGLGDVQIDFYNGGGDHVDSTSTNASGLYTSTTTLPSGSYYVQFTPNSSGSACAYIPEYYNGKLTLAAATPVAVTAPNATLNVDAALARGSAIQGRVADATTNAGIEDVSIGVYDSGGQWVASGRTNGSGVYVTEPALPSGSYRIGFFPRGDSSYFDQYYNGKPSLALSDPVAVTAPVDKTGVDAALAKGGAISGTVRAADTGLPLRYIYVVVYDSAGDEVAYGSTDQLGAYTTSGLPSGSYRVGFFSGGEGGNGLYIDEYYNDQPTLATAGAVVVSAPAVTSGVDATLARGSTIAGRVTAAGTGVGLPNVWVQVYDSGGKMVTGGQSGADGRYITYGAVPSGSYRVQFSPYGGSAVYASEFYNDKPNLAAATPIAVSAPTSVTGIDAVLNNGGRIAGTVTGQGGAGLYGVQVEVYDSAGNLIVTGETGSAGGYITPAVRSGSYRVHFVPPSYNDLLGQYIPEFYNDKPSLATASAVTVNASTTTAGINAVLAKGAQIAGRVQAAGPAAASMGISASALGQPGVQVAVYDSSGTQVAAGETNGLGVYLTTPGLRSGSYRLGFQPAAQSGYMPSFYAGKATLATATPITVTAPNLRSGIDDILLRGIYLPVVRR